MSTLFGGDIQADAPIGGPDDLLRPFHEGIKTPDRRGIGLEYERLPLRAASGRAAPYDAPDGSSVHAVLARLERDHGWSAQRESGRIIALEKGTTRLTLEPGAQVEMSGGVHHSLAAARAELNAFVAETDRAAAAHSIVLAGLGYHPLSEFDSIGWVPKSRYQIMGPYLASRGHLAHAMMKATAGCQINLDYTSEADAADMLRAAMGISSVVTALCANSPLTRGQANGFATRRSHIWMHTDPDRTGLLAIAFGDGAGFRQYVDCALDVPMMFVVRDGRWVDMTGRTFRGYLAGRTEGLKPTMADWDLHLTTLFPEVRLKRYVEVRGSDSGPPSIILAQAALWKGILYNEASRRAAWKLVSGPTFAERQAFHRAVVRQGLRARLGSRPALELARVLITLAHDGLPESERGVLDPLRALVAREGAGLSDQLLLRWRGAWGRDPLRMIEALATGTGPERD